MELITSKDNRRLKALRRLFGDRLYRRESRCFATEGLRLTEEALRLGHALRELYITEGAQRRLGPRLNGLMAGAEQSFLLPDRLLNSLSDTRSPQGVMGVFSQPEEIPPPTTGGTIMLCHIQEPGNVGAVLRTAAAFGVYTALSSDCPDPFSPKVLRASMGGVLGGRWSVVEDTEGYIAARKDSGSPVYGAVLSENSRPPHELELKDALILLGNEGAGLPESLIKLTDGGVFIPMLPAAESLNVAVAASILAYEMVRGGLRP